MARIFISYRREDSAGYAGRLHEELVERLGPGQVFRDVDTLRPGEDFDSAIRQRLAGCDVCLVLIGPGWLRSTAPDGGRRLDAPGDYVRLEVAAALARPEVLVLPVLVGAATMPPAGELPDDLTPLARRHAFSVRDETWEADMDRLAAVLQAAGATTAGSPAGPARSGSPPAAAPARRTLVTIGAIAAAVVLGLLWWAGTPGDSGSGSVGLDAEGAAVAPLTGPAYGIDVPTAGAEISHDELVFAVLSGSVQPRGDSLRVWLRVRISNEGFTDVYVGDQTFALVNGASVVPATGGLNEVLDRRSLRQVVLRFDVPISAAAALRVTHGGESADLPLDLTGNGSPPRHEEPDPRDGLSHAHFVSIVRDERPLAATPDVTTSAMRVTLRRFVNKQRITVVVRWRNDRRYAVATNDLLLRLAIAGERLAPVRAPSEVVEPDASYVGDVVFEAPVGATSGSLHATLGESGVELPLTF